ncbi:hypothetical protein ADK64_28580 [Streptomyces sp. MMG1121]|nr:hypothetical protein ADK64_28580 [Streptomyces sp. MMG1121]
MAALDSLGRGPSRVIEVDGDRGAGKTQLLGELRQEARQRGFETPHGRSTPAEQHTPFRAFTSALPGRFAPLPPLWKPAAPTGSRPSLTACGTVVPHGYRSQIALKQEMSADTEELRGSLAELAHDGLVLTLDDFHWADAESIELLDHLIRRPIPAPLLIVVSCRGRQAPPRLRGALTKGTRLGTVASMKLPSLALQRAASLLAVPPQHDRISAAPAPHYILAEVSALPGDDRAVVAALSVLGDGYGAHELALVAGIPAEAAARSLNRLVSGGLARTAAPGHGYHLHRPDLAALLYDHTDPQWRAGAHRRALDVLARHSASPAAHATHIDLAQDAAGNEATRRLIRAAERSMWSAPGAAADWLRPAYESTKAREGQGPATDRLNLLFARALILSGQLVEGQRLLRTYLQSAPRYRRRSRAAAAAFCGLVEGLLGHQEEANALLTAELEELAHDPPPETVGIYVTQCLIALLHGRPWDRTAGDAAARIAARHQDRLAEIGALVLRALCRVLGPVPGPESAERAASTCAAAIDEMPDALVAQHPEYLALLGRCESLLGRFADARRHFERGIAILRAAGHTHLLPLFLTGLGTVYAHIGPLDEMRRAAREARRIAAKTDAKPLYGAALALESWYAACTDRDGSKTAVRLAWEAIAALPPGTSSWSMAPCWALANAMRLVGDAQQSASAVVALGGGQSLPKLPVILRPIYLEMLADADAEAGTIEHTWDPRAQVLPPSLPKTLLSPYSFAARAHALRAQGELSAAVKAYDEASELMSRAGMIGARAKTLLARAECAAELGRHKEAIDVLITCKMLAQKYGSRRMFKTAVDLERDLRSRTSEDAAADRRSAPLGELTDREREVADLAGKGLRTKDIAKALELSPRTVDVHLNRIYRKLEIRSRAELAHLIATAS